MRTAASCRTAAVSYLLFVTAPASGPDIPSPPRKPVCGFIELSGAARRSIVDAARAGDGTIGASELGLLDRLVSLDPANAQVSRVRAAIRTHGRVLIRSR
jgi:hypothetical protein